MSTTPDVLRSSVRFGSVDRYAAQTPQPVGWEHKIELMESLQQYRSKSVTLMRRPDMSLPRDSLLQSYASLLSDDIVDNDENAEGEEVSVVLQDDFDSLVKRASVPAELMRRQLEEIALNQVKQLGTGLTPSLPIPDGLAQSAAAAALTAKSDHLVGNTENEGEQGAAAAAAARKKVMEVQKRDNYYTRKAAVKHFPMTDVVVSNERLKLARNGVSFVNIRDESLMSADEVFPPLSYDVNVSMVRRQKKGKRTGAELWAIALHKLRVLSQFRVKLLRKDRAPKRSNQTVSAVAVVVARFLRKRGKWDQDDDDVAAVRRRIQQIEMEQQAGEKAQFIMQATTRSEQTARSHRSTAPGGQLVDRRDLVKLPPPLETLIPLRVRKQRVTPQGGLFDVGMSRHTSASSKQLSEGQFGARYTSGGMHTRVASRPGSLLRSQSPLPASQTPPARSLFGTGASTVSLVSGGAAGSATPLSVGAAAAAAATGSAGSSSLPSPAVAKSQQLPQQQQQQQQQQQKLLQQQKQGQTGSYLPPISGSSPRPARRPGSWSRFFQEETDRVEKDASRRILATLAEREFQRTEVLRSGFMLGKAADLIRPHRRTVDMDHEQPSLWVKSRDHLLADPQSLPTRREFYRRITRWLVQHGGLQSVLEGEVISMVKEKLQEGCAVDPTLLDPVRELVETQKMTDSPHLKAFLEFLEKEVLFTENFYLKTVEHIRNTV